MTSVNHRKAVAGKLYLELRSCNQHCPEQTEESDTSKLRLTSLTGMEI
jgi:hypothetical protein